MCKCGGRVGWEPGSDAPDGLMAIFPLDQKSEQVYVYDITAERSSPSGIARLSVSDAEESVKNRRMHDDSCKMTMNLASCI